MPAGKDGLSMTSEACLKKTYPGEIGLGGKAGDGREGAWAGKLQLDSGRGRALGQISSSFSSSWFEIGLRSGSNVRLLGGDFEFTRLGKGAGLIFLLLVKVLRAEFVDLGSFPERNGSLGSCDLTG